MSECKLCILVMISIKLMISGLWFSPECKYVQECIKMSQRSVTGWVRLELYKGSGL